MGRLKAIITDFDGTLFDTLDANYYAYKEAFDKCGIELDKDSYMKNFGLRFNEMCEKLNVPERKRKELKEIKRDVYPKYFKHIYLNESLKWILENYKKLGIKICIASTASKNNIYNILDCFGMKELFDYIITGEDVKEGKPNPEVYLKALELCDCKADEAIVYEDSEVGFQAAENANINYIKVKL